MDKYYKENNELNEVAEKVLPLMDWPVMPNIKFLMLHADRSNYFGKCSRATGKWRYLTNVDFVVEVFNYFWKNADIRAKEALIFHELLHVDISEKDDGAIVFGIKKHDIEEFVAVSQYYGAWNEDLKKFIEVINNYLENV